MLRELHISNLAVIADARIELHGGLNCFTGATGAGKSLVIGAIELLLGMKSPAEMLRAGSDEGRVSGIFEISNPRHLHEIERLADVALANDGSELLITRRLHASGRTSASLNGHPITLSMLRCVAELLVDVHGQHDHQYLLRSANQLQVIDEFGGLLPLREQYHETWLQLNRCRRELEQLLANRTLRNQQLELYRFQSEEIDAAQLDAAEFAELRSRASVLANLEKLKKEAGATHAALYEADGSVLERLKMIAAVLAELSELDQNMKPIASAVRDATLGLEDAAFDLVRYLDRLDLDPAELAEVEERLNTINRILNKYGDPIETALQYRGDIGRKIVELERQTDDCSQLQQQIDPLERQLWSLGSELSRARRVAAKKLAPKIERELAQLGMEKAKFTVSFADSNPDIESATAAGFDQVEFTIQTNPGLPPQPLRKIASGGELSRIMLALKGVLAAGDRVSVLVFDEIDANVGGRLGSVIGSKLRALASHHQVLCITHLPQIASYADLHLSVRKHTDGRETRTSVRRIDGHERLEELAEMIGGQRTTETTRAQAGELLEAATKESNGRARRSRAGKTRQHRAESS